MEGSVEFVNHEVEFEAGQPGLVAEWIGQIIRKHKHSLQHLTVIFCSDEYLLEMNREHLGHDYYTDVITFPYHPEKSKAVIGDIFISIHRVKENAVERGIHPVDELHRVIIHGVLHLLGFDDRDEPSKARMRKEEDLALSLRMF